MCNYKIAMITIVINIHIDFHIDIVYYLLNINW